MEKSTLYRADIDGLRAVAVILVILFHADLSFIAGGYTGVDVFFVISGYLITSSINKEMTSGLFSFKQFYLRRIRRIIPVLVFVMIVITIPGCLFLFANDLEAYGRTVLHTMLSTNNFHLWSNGNDYFVDNTELIPLLHTWSLSVEEQFYVIWPPILLLLHRNFNLKKRLVLIVFLIVIGLALSTYMAIEDPNTAYFLLPARLFEMLLGAGLALFWNRIPALSIITNHILSILGLGLIFVPAFVLNSDSIFPGYNALWSCLGAVFIILSGKNSDQQGLGNKLLAAKPMVFIGLLSYSMYLWHWPVFVFIKYLGFDLDITLIGLAIGLTFILSYLSWRFVEKPFRYRFKYNFAKTLWVVLLPCLIISGLIYGVLDAKNGFPDRFPNLAEFDKNANFPNKVRRNCFNNLKVGNCDECSLGIKKDVVDGILIGDSFANHTAAFLDVLAKDAGLYIHDSAASGYPLLYDVDDITGEPTRDVVYGIKRLDYAKKLKTVYIASNWERFNDPNSKNYQFVLENIKELIELGKKVVIFDALRTSNDMTLHKMKMFKTNNLASLSKGDVMVPFYKRSNDYIVYKIAKQFPAVQIINLNDVMCSGEWCDYQVNNTIVYRNGNHLNTSGAMLLAQKFINKKGNPLK